MPVLNIGGRSVEIGDDFLKLTPEQQSAQVEEISGSLGPSAKDTAIDVAKSGGVGVGKGLIGLAGMPGDIRGMASAATDYAGKKLGVEPEKVERFKDAAQKVAQFAPDPFTRMVAAGPTSAAIKGKVEEQTGEFYKPQTTVGKYAETVGEFVPAAIGGPGGVARRLLVQAVAPGLASEAAGEAVKGTQYEKYEPHVRIAAGMLAPAGVGVAQRLVTPFPVSAERQAMVDALRNEGVDLTAGQATGSRALRFAESHAGDTLGGSGRAAEIGERQKEQFTAAALRRAGEPGNRTSPEIMDRAFTRIGNDFDQLSANNTVRADPQFGQDLTNTVREYYSLVNPSQRAPVIEGTARDIIDAVRNNNGQLSGQSYQAMRSRLDRLARGAQADPQLSDALFGLRNSLDDAMERSMIAAGRTDDVARWQNARREYRNLLVVEKAASSAGEDAALGLVSPAQLRSATVAQNRRNYVRGDGDFAELARAGAATMLPMPNSGTPGRIAAQTLPTLLGAGVGHLVSPGGGGASLGAGLGSMVAATAPPLVNRAVMSDLGQAYFGNQLLGQPPADRDRLLRMLLASSSARQSVDSRQ